MTHTINLASQLKKHLPAELLLTLQRAGTVASDYGQTLYLVGGGVRDLLLESPIFDLDLVVEGEAIALAQKLAEEGAEKVTTHPRFGTAKLHWKNFIIDLATARSETYAKPGALPTVSLDSKIKEDLFRRDFTINAMAIHLNPTSYGELTDPYGGRTDLKRGIIRILHPNSFIDDATRILRGIRYEQRLDFQIEHLTEELLRESIPMMSTVSGDRLRHELELILKEKCPEKVLCRAEELGVLKELHLSMRGSGWLKEKFRLARLSSTTPYSIYMPLLIYHLPKDDCQHFIERLRIPRSTVTILQDTLILKTKLHLLSNSDLVPSVIYRLLQNYSPTAILATAVASDDTTVQKNLHLYLDKLRYVRTSLNGTDLMKMGVVPSQELGKMLQALMKAKLDGMVKTKKEEESMVRLWLSSSDQAVGDKL